MVFHSLTFMVGSVMNMRGENIISSCSENTLNFLETRVKMWIVGTVIMKYESAYRKVE